jgi:hypothetical protein
MWIAPACRPLFWVYRCRSVAGATAGSGSGSSSGTAVAKGARKKDGADPVRGPGMADAFFLVDVPDSPLSAPFIHEVVEIDFIIEIVVR